ncbi:MAG TPA: hypothetical protein VM261_13470 [Kofleriaceae bacterium]|nr:hypothetical protein [Kofleriaceae bacterium]
MTTLAQANAILEAQRAFFREDAELEREAAIWRDASAEECFAAVIALCEEADFFLSRLGPGELERTLRPVPSPYDVRLLPGTPERSCGG